MEAKTFSKYESACSFRDKVDGQIEWCRYRGKSHWIVWYSKKNKKEVKA